MSDTRSRIMLKRGEALKAQALQQSDEQPVYHSAYPLARATGIVDSSSSDSSQSNNQSNNRPITSLPSGVTTRSAANRRQASLDVSNLSNDNQVDQVRRSHSQQPSLSLSSSIKHQNASRSNSVSRVDDDGWEAQIARMQHSNNNSPSLRSPSINSPSLNSPSINQSTPSRSNRSNHSHSVPLSPIVSPEPGAPDEYSDDSDFEHVEPGAMHSPTMPVAQPIHHSNNQSDERFRNPFFDESDESNVSNRAVSRGRSRASTGLSRMTMSKSFDERSLPARVIGRATMSFAAELSSLEEHPAIQRLANICDSLPFISTLSQKFHVSSLYVTLWICLAIVLLSYNVLGLTQLLSIVTLLYPCYMSYHTLEDEDGDGEHVNTRFWLVYWCVFGMTRCVTSVLDKVFESTAYTICKLVFTIYCFHPATRGCDVVFNYFIHPLYRANRSAIEHATDTLTYFISDMIDESKVVIKSAVVGAIAGQANERPARRPRNASQIKVK